MTNKINIDGLAAITSQFRDAISATDTAVTTGTNLRILNLMGDLASIVGSAIAIVKDQEERLFSLERDKENERERRAGADW